jgi:hypothetical protein
MYAVLGLVSLVEVISDRKLPSLPWTEHHGRMDWSRLRGKNLTSWVRTSRRRTGTLLLARPQAITHKLQRIGFKLDKATVQLDVSQISGAGAQDRDASLARPGTPQTGGDGTNPGKKPV